MAVQNLDLPAVRVMSRQKRACVPACMCTHGDFCLAAPSHTPPPLTATITTTAYHSPSVVAGCLLPLIEGPSHPRLFHQTQIEGMKPASPSPDPGYQGTCPPQPQQFQRPMLLHARCPNHCHGGRNRRQLSGCERLQTDLRCAGPPTALWRCLWGSTTSNESRERRQPRSLCGGGCLAGLGVVRGDIGRAV